MERRLNRILLVVIIAMICCISMGYSVLNRELNISGELTYRPQNDIRITNFTTSNKPDNMYIDYSDFSTHEVKLGYTTTDAASITYEVEVTNYSTVDMGILKIDGLDSNVVVQEGIIGTNLIGAGRTKTFTITFNSTSTITKTYLLKFDFEKVCTVSYFNLGNTDDYVKEVLNSEQLRQVLRKGEDVCSIIMSEKGYTDYTFSNQTLIIPSVTGNVIIFGYSPVAEEPTIPNPPELNGDMIPVRYEQTTVTTGNWVKADETNKDNDWYDYSAQKWANAVTVVADGTQTRDYYKRAAVGTVISMDDINTMWVWIPRYSYTIKSEDGGLNYYGKKSSCAVPTRELPGQIDVKFIPTSENDNTGSAQYTGIVASGWRTNDAFNFPETDNGGENTSTARAGIWVGKFEVTGSLEKTGQACIDTRCNVSDITVKPGLSSLRNQTVSSFFYMSRSMQISYADTYGFSTEKGDLHMMKSDEWGAVAYLSQSMYGRQGNIDYSGTSKEIYTNKVGNYITGYSAGKPNASNSEIHYVYNDMTELEVGNGQAGPGASTTGTVYGVYDMSGGAYEYVMGVLEYDAQGVEEHNGQIVSGRTSSYNSGFKGLDEKGNLIGSIGLPNKKYYNTYKSTNPTSSNFYIAKSVCNGGVCYGHALSETYGATSGSSGWYRDGVGLVNRSSSWLSRSTIYNNAPFTGSAETYSSCRLVLV